MIQAVRWPLSEHFPSARGPHAIDPLLSDTQIADVLDRRATALSYIAALIEERGEEDVLFFP